MTSPAEGGPPARPRGRLLRVALVLSVILNLLFIGGLVWIQSVLPRPLGPGERFMLAARELDLSPEQKRSVQDLLVDVRSYNRKLRESNRPLIDGVWDELTKSQPDAAKIDQLVDQAMANRHAYQKQLTAAVGRFLSVLTPEQRLHFSELVREPHDRSPARLLKRLLAP